MSNMIEMHLADLDLNLLLVLHVLLEERSVTRAAARLSRTQPAVSRSLGRLRALLSDPLLVREGAELRPTPRAEALGPAVRRILEDVQDSVLRSTPFDPATATRRLTISAADYAGALILPDFIAALAVEAPGVDVVVIPGNRSMAQTADEVDLAVGPIGRTGAALRTRPLIEDRFLVIVRVGHPDVGDALDLETYLRLPHVLVAPRGTPGGVVDDALAKIGGTRRVALRVADFLVAPLVVERTDYLVTLPASFARFVARGRPLRCLEPPVAVPPFVLSLGWHERWHHDPGHAWLRDRLVTSFLAGAGAGRGRSGG